MANPTPRGPSDEMSAQFLNSLFHSMRPNMMFNPLDPSPQSLNSGRIPFESLFNPRPPVPPMPPVRVPIQRSVASSSLHESKEQYELKVDDESSNDYIRSDQYVDYKKLCDDNLECSICLNIISGTVAITTCMHRFCSSCLFEYMMKKSGNASCPNCRASIDNLEDVMISSELSDILDVATIKCKNKECAVELPRKEYKNHMNTCEFNKKQCKGCKSLYFEKNFHSHEEECESRLVKCNLCNSYVKFKDQKTHRGDVCPVTMVKCPNKKCNYLTQRSKINKHGVSCVYRIVTCSNGCGSVFDHKEQSFHDEICNHRSVKCEFCNINVQYSNLIEHHSLCPKKPIECEWCRSTVVFGSMTNHEMVCSKKKVKCSQDCGVKMERGDLSKHMEECLNRYVKCGDCSQQYILSRNVYHEMSCSEKIVTCPDCSQTIPRKNIYFHSQTNCEMKLGECKYAYAGCSCKFIRKTENEHYREYKDLHLEILDKYIQEKVRLPLSRPRNFFEDRPTSYFAPVQSYSGAQPVASPVLSSPPPRVENRPSMDRSVVAPQVSLDLQPMEYLNWEISESDYDEDDEDDQGIGPVDRE